MKIFVTGASGYIGGRLTEKLAAGDHEVTILLRNINTDYRRHKNINVVRGDLSDLRALKNGMYKCDWVYHLAAYARPTSRDGNLPWRTNVEGTANVLRVASDEGVKKVVVTSSAATMGCSATGQPVAEDTNIDLRYHTEYEKNKAIAEKMALEYSTPGMDVVVVNPSRVYGPGRMTVSNSVTRIIDLYGRGMWRIIPGTGKAIGNYVFIDDVVNGHILAALHGRSGQRYILGGENISFTTFFETLGRVYGKKRKLITISSASLKKIAGITGFVNGLAGRPPLISGDWIDKYLENWVLSSEKAKQELSYVITPFETGVRKTVEWLKGDRAYPVITD